jgi:hypothetical protein
MYSTKCNAKSIGDNFKITAYLVLNRFAKNAKNNDFFASTTENKKAVILKLSPIDLALNFVRQNFYRS